MSPRRRIAILLTGLVLFPALAGVPAPAQSGESTYYLVDVSRSGSNVTFEVGASQTNVGVTVSLYSGGSLVALPEQRVSHWNHELGPRAFTFTLMKEIETASLSIRWSWDGESYSQTINTPIPSRDASGSGAARVIVNSATIRDGKLTVDLSNIGDGSTGRMLVSLEDAQQRKIAEPYYRELPDIPAGAVRNASFTVSAGLQNVVVALDYAGSVERVSVVVRAASSGGSPAGEANVTLTTDLPFLDVDIGRDRTFTVQVRNTGRPSLVHLEVDGLPEGYSYRYFVGGAAVPSLLLGNQSRPVTLSVTVPNDVDEVDRSVEFAAVAKVNGTVLARLEMGVVVRGVGKLEISGEEVFASVAPGGTGRFTIAVRNSGTAPLFNVELASQRGYGWQVRFEPRVLDRIDPGESTPVTVEVRAPEVIGPGRYPTDVSAKTGDVVSRTTTLSVEIPDSGEGGSWLWMVFLSVIGGTLGFAYWKKRRGSFP